MKIKYPKSISKFSTLLTGGFVFLLVGCGQNGLDRKLDFSTTDSLGESVGLAAKEAPSEEGQVFLEVFQAFIAADIAERLSEQNREIDPIKRAAVIDDNNKHFSKLSNIPARDVAVYYLDERINSINSQLNIVNKVKEKNPIAVELISTNGAELVADDRLRLYIKAKLTELYKPDGWEYTTDPRDGNASATCASEVMIGDKKYPAAVLGQVGFSATDKDGTVSDITVELTNPEGVALFNKVAQEDPKQLGVLVSCHPRAVYFKDETTGQRSVDIMTDGDNLKSYVAELQNWRSALKKS